MASCNTCGYRVNPNTAKRAGLVDYEDDLLKDYCYYSRSYVRRQMDCSNWIDCSEVDYEVKFFRESS